MCVWPNCNKSELVNHPGPITTTPLATITFSDSNTYNLNPTEDIGNLPAAHTQSEITAELSDPKLSSELFNGVNSPLTGKEGEVTAVVAKTCCIATENPVRKNIKHFTGCHTCNTVIKILLVSESDGDLLFMKKKW